MAIMIDDGGGEGGGGGGSNGGGEGSNGGSSTSYLWRIDPYGVRGGSALVDNNNTVISTSSSLNTESSITINGTTYSKNVLLSSGTSASAGVNWTWYEYSVNVSSSGGTVSVQTSGTTTPTLTLTSVPLALNGLQFRARVSNAGGLAVSNAATISVTVASTGGTDVAPTISSQPASSTITQGTPVTLSVVASGTSPLTFTWFQNGSAVLQPNSPFLTVTPSATSTYYCVVSNTVGSVTSATVTLTVQPLSNVTHTWIVDPYNIYGGSRLMDSNNTVISTSSTLNTDATISINGVTYTRGALIVSGTASSGGVNWTWYQYSASASTIPQSTNDQYWNDVQLCLPMTGSNGSTVFTDYSATPKTISINGSVMISTDQSKYGGTSAFLPNWSWIDVQGLPANIFTGDWTVEGWMYHTGGANQTFFNTIPHAVFAVSVNNAGSGNTLFLVGDGTTWTASALSTGTLAANTWNHIAVVRSGTSTTLYHNGVAQGTLLNTAPAEMSVGRIGAITVDYDNWQTMYGYIDDFRITKAARYTADFTPPLAIPTSGTGGGTDGGGGGGGGGGLDESGI